MTKRNKFRLSTVLRVARIEEEREQLRTAAAARLVERAKEEESQRQISYDNREAFEVPASATRFQQQSQLGHLRAEALQAANVASLDAADRLEIAREELLARARRTRTLEDLEERHHVMTAVAAARAAQRTLDDLVRFRRAM